MRRAAVAILFAVIAAQVYDIRGHRAVLEAARRRLDDGVFRVAILGEQVAHWDARLIERFARDRAVDIVRIADVVQLSPLDHFHPGAAGYAAIAARIAPAL